jgi:hypothetical protein
MCDFTESMRQEMRELRAAREEARGHDSARVRLAISRLESLCDADAGLHETGVHPVPDQRRRPVAVRKHSRSTITR